MQAYPIHPEVFDRLYEDWTTLQSFQRTRGVLKLMAKVIYRLWKDQNQDLMILPGSLPLYDSNTRNELTYYLAPGWDAVLERDVDGDRAETTELETKEPRFLIEAVRYFADPDVCLNTIVKVRWPDGVTEMTSTKRLCHRISSAT